MSSARLRAPRSPYSARRTSSSRAKTRPPPNSDFVQFVHHVLDVCFLPITYPLRVIRNVVTSPLTITVVLKALLAVFLVLASAVFSILAVGAFWWSWGTGGSVEVEGWLIYGSRAHRTPHALMTLPVDRFQEDLPYDVQVELELVRPTREADDSGNFMVTLELRSLREPNTTVIRVSQTSLPPPPLPSSVVSIFGLANFPTWLLPPCIVPWPFRFLCPSRIFGYAGVPDARIKERRRRGTMMSPARGKEVVLLTKELLEQVTITPARGQFAIGSAFVSIGREDSEVSPYKEVRTTGWVVVRFIPHPTGIRWLLTANPLPPLIILPPLSLSLTIASALIGFLIISFCFGRGRERQKSNKFLTGSVGDDSATESETAQRRAGSDIPSRSHSSPLQPEASGRPGRVLRVVQHPSPSELSDEGTEPTLSTPSNTLTGDTASATETATEGTEGTDATDATDTWTESESWESS